MRVDQRSSPYPLCKPKPQQINCLVMCEQRWEATKLQHRTIEAVEQQNGVPPYPDERRLSQWLRGSNRLTLDAWARAIDVDSESLTSDGRKAANIFINCQFHLLLLLLVVFTTLLDIGIFAKATSMKDYFACCSWLEPLPLELERLGAQD